ncbi:MAG: HEXXH motif-containing putative peptide modification protein [Paracoccaceae bacterium]|nr:HEXXH motif-containing putative peptide modification protein [Paracoccaceae bacterium]
MYNLLGEATCIDIVSLVCGGEGRYLESDDLVKDYRRKFSSQYNVPFATDGGTMWVNETDVEKSLLSLIDKDSPLNDYERYRDSNFLYTDEKYRGEISADVDHIRRSVERYTETDPDYWNYWSLIISHMTCPRTDYTTRGGTTSGAIGVIYACNPRRHADIDLNEFLIHEATHHGVFLFELSYGLYDYNRVAMRENYAQAALSCKMRPLDKVLHSIVIGTEILLQRQRLGLRPAERPYHGTTEELAQGVWSSIIGVQSDPNLYGLLTEGGRWLLDYCAQELAEVGFGRRSRFMVN